MDKKFIGLTSLLFLSITLLVVSVVSQGNIFRILNPRANQEASASEVRSIMFAWPLTVPSGNSDIKVDVFIRNTDDKPIPNKKVTLSSSLGTSREIVNPTDHTGKATFSVSSAKPGVATVTAVVDNVKLNQQLTLKFE